MVCRTESVELVEVNAPFLKGKTEYLENLGKNMPFFPLLGECNHCRVNHRVLEDLMERDGNVWDFHPGTENITFEM